LKTSDQLKKMNLPELEQEETDTEKYLNGLRCLIKFTEEMESIKNVQLNKTNPES